jgi:RsiW-degrading membrane proteinase PrsW (M82 family)
LLGFDLSHLPNLLGASSAGIIEETGKLLALALVVNNPRFGWALNGLLFGGAVGAGFAGFESAGYALEVMGTEGISSGLANIWLRAFLAPGGHVAWTALVGAALWKVKGSQPFSFSMLQDYRFLRVFGFAILCHMLWNSPFQLPYAGTQIALTVVAWIAILSFIQDGLKQVQEKQLELSSA